VDFTGRAQCCRSEVQHPARRNSFSLVSNPKGLNTKTNHTRLEKRSYTMRAAFLPVSFSLWRLSSAITSSKSVFLRHVGAIRIAAACLLFILLVMMVPKADILETLFDEANTPTNEMVVEKAASAWEHPQSVVALVPRIFPQPRTSVRRMLPVYAGWLTNSRRFRELICSLLC
jgi:hypothetical protein